MPLFNFFLPNWNFDTVLTQEANRILFRLEWESLEDGKKTTTEFRLIRGDNLSKQEVASWRFPGSVTVTGNYRSEPASCSAKRQEISKCFLAPLPLLSFLLVAETTKQYCMLLKKRLGRRGEALVTRPMQSRSTENQNHLLTSQDTEEVKAGRLLRRFTFCMTA